MTASSARSPHSSDRRAQLRRSSGLHLSILSYVDTNKKGGKEKCVRDVGQVGDDAGECGEEGVAGRGAAQLVHHFVDEPEVGRQTR
jgi:hypothetical protein